MTERTPDDPDDPIGRGRPPIWTRFQKGQSGNPKGRPKKQIAEVDPAAAEMSDLILGEAQRLITVSEGVTLPAAQIVSKAMVVSAGKGNAQAQGNFLRLAVKAQAEQKKTRDQLLGSAYWVKIVLDRLKLRWFAEARAGKGWDPHPSDIVIEWVKGEVKWYAVFTEEEWMARKALLDLRDEQQSILKRSWATVAEDGDDYFLELGREMARDTIHMINEHLAPRFREEPHPSLGDAKHPTPEATFSRPLKPRRRAVKTKSV